MEASYRRKCRFFDALRVSPNIAKARHIPRASAPKPPIILQMKFFARGTYTWESENTFKRRRVREHESRHAAVFNCSIAGLGNRKPISAAAAGASIALTRSVRATSSRWLLVNARRLENAFGRAAFINLVSYLPGKPPGVVSLIASALPAEISGLASECFDAANPCGSELIGSELFVVLCEGAAGRDEGL